MPSTRSTDRATTPRSAPPRSARSRRKPAKLRDEDAPPEDHGAGEAAPEVREPAGAEAPAAAPAIGVAIDRICWCGGWSVQARVVYDYVDPTCPSSLAAYRFFGWLLPRLPVVKPHETA